MNDRDKKLEDASDVSEVETVVPSNALFSVDVNLDNLNQHLASLKKTLHEQKLYLQKLEHQVSRRATEKVMGTYMGRIALAVPATMG